MSELYLSDRTDKRKCYCNNCEWTGIASKTMQPVRDVHDRLEPGEEIPIGECPKCSALCYLKKLRKEETECRICKKDAVFVAETEAMSPPGVGKIAIPLCLHCKKAFTLGWRQESFKISRAPQ